MKKILAFSSIGLLLVAALVFYWQNPLDLAGNQSEEMTAQSPETQNDQSVASKEGAPSSEKQKSQDFTSEDDPNLPANESSELKDFKAWLGTEVSRMTGPIKDAELLELQLQEKAKNLKPEEMAHLRQTLSEPKAPANLRILSVFLLAKVGPAASSVLKDYLDSPMPKLDPKPHSLDETRLMQEKAIREMARQALESTKDPEK